MAEIQGEEDGAWTGRHGSDLDGHNGNVWILSQEQWKLLKDHKLWGDHENGAGIVGSTVSRQDEGREQREEVITIIQIGNNGVMGQSTGYKDGE